MHHHCEIIMPPKPDVEAAIEQIMAPFSEGNNESRHQFWDWYAIGGRWAGVHLEASCDPEKRKAFTAALNERKVTVSGLVWGKEELSPASQIPMVDALWQEFFPDNPAKQCPMFMHYNPANSSTKGYPDVMQVGELPKYLSASRVIVAHPSYSDPEKLEAEFMLESSYYNGVTWVDAKWEGDVAAAIAMYTEKLKHYKEEYAAKNAIKPDWLLVTVDYHS